MKFRLVPPVVHKALARSWVMSVSLAAGPDYVHSPPQGAFLVQGMGISPSHLQFINETLYELAGLPETPPHAGDRVQE